MERHSRYNPVAPGRPQVTIRLADPPRNGLPPAKPYAWNPGEAERRAGGAARLAAGRGRVNPPHRPAAAFDPEGEAAPPGAPPPPAPGGPRPTPPPAPPPPSLPLTAARPCEPRKVRRPARMPQPPGPGGPLSNRLPLHRLRRRAGG